MHSIGQGDLEVTGKEAAGRNRNKLEVGTMSSQDGGENLRT